MRITPSRLPEVLLIEPVVHRDARGWFLETFHAERFTSCLLPANYVQDNHSRSTRGTLRGLHWQWRRPQSKLVRVVRGEIFDVAVDIRRGSSTFGMWSSVRMSDDNLLQAFIPAGYAHGFCVISDTADVEYKCTDYYDPGGEAGLLWNDPALGIEWPVMDPLLSPKDAGFPPLAGAAHLPVLGPAGELSWSD